MVTRELATEAPARALPPLTRDELAYIWSSLRRLGVAERDLEDVTHDVAVIYYRRADGFDEARPLKPWLFGIAVRVAGNHARLAHHRREELVSSAPDSIDDASSAERRVEVMEARDTVVRALATIDPDKRAVLVMHDLDDIGAPEIAETLSIPLNTVYSRLRIAREELRSAVRRARLPRGAP